MTHDDISAEKQHIREREWEKLQLLDEEISETGHDFRIDLIVSPVEVIRIPKSLRRRPSGIIRSHLTEGKIAEVPVLRALGL